MISEGSARICTSAFGEGSTPVSGRSLLAAGGISGVRGGCGGSVLPVRFVANNASNCSRLTPAIIEHERQHCRWCGIAGVKMPPHTVQIVVVVSIENASLSACETL